MAKFEAETEAKRSATERNVSGTERNAVGAGGTKAGTERSAVRAGGADAGVKRNVPETERNATDGAGGVSGFEEVAETAEASAMVRNYQQGQSYFKHYVEIRDDEGAPIRVNKKFRENHPNMDVSKLDVIRIKDKVFYHSKPASENRKKMDGFRGKKIPETNPFGAMPQYLTAGINGQAV